MLRFVEPSSRPVAKEKRFSFCWLFSVPKTARVPSLSVVIVIHTVALNPVPIFWRTAVVRGDRKGKWCKWINRYEQYTIGLIPMKTPCPMLQYIYYRPQQSCAKVMFLHLSVILFTGGCLPQCMLRYTPPLGRPPWPDTPPGRHPPGRPPLDRHPHPNADGYYSGWYASY